MGRPSCRIHVLMRKLRQDDSQTGAPPQTRSAADELLAALDIDPDRHDAVSAAAFRALAEEVLHLRDGQARLRQALEEAERLADHDALCPVFNRRAFERELAREIALAERHGTPLCLVYLDLDRFKLVNDRFGHAAGDEALRQVCAIIRAHFRQTDIVGRLGGDEFGIILTHAELADARLKAEQLTERLDRLRFSGPQGSPGEPVSLGASCGVVAWTGQADTSLLISEADEAMFRAKSARKRGRACDTSTLNGFSSDSP